MKIRCSQCRREINIPERFIENGKAKCGACSGQASELARFFDERELRQTLNPDHTSSPGLRRKCGLPKMKTDIRIDRETGR